MSGAPAAGVFGHRNARSKTPREVAEGFVAPPQYWEIAQPGNTVLSGPRGSGKTTLLKMLLGPGLEHWKHPEADKARQMVNYSGVFVPADRSWSGQVAMYEPLDDQLRTGLGDACYTLHALRALSRTASQRVSPDASSHPHDRVEMERTEEERIVRETWQSWALSKPVGSFQGLGEAMGDLIAEVGRLALRAQRLGEVDALREHPALDLDLVNAAGIFIDRFNNAVGDPDHVWALLIDEIEFLPQGIHTGILASMRGRDPRLIRKISVAPYTLVTTRLVDNPFAAWEGHDLETVDLTFQEKEEGYSFSRALIEKEVDSLGLSPQELLGGPGFFEAEPGKDAYEPGSRNAEAIASLAQTDPSFRTWLEERGIDPDAPAEVTGVQRAATVRKAMPIILLRDTYLHSVRGTLQRRSRKAPDTYAGELSAYAICENNPRLLQSLASRLMRAHDERRLTDGIRGEVVDEIAHRFAHYLRATKVPESAPQRLLPARFIETVGKYFAARVYDGDFDPEPPLSFEASVSSLEGSAFEQILSQLVFYGAVVPISQDRFRLAHAFAPIYRLPLRTGRPIALKSILGEEPVNQLEQMRIDAEEASGQ
jgi:hypothetical protein